MFGISIRLRSIATSSTHTSCSTFCLGTQVPSLSLYCIEVVVVLRCEAGKLKIWSLLQLLC